MSIRDDTVEILRGCGATVVTIDPQTFNHGLTRDLATKYARGHVYGFVNQSTLPANDRWLENLIRPLEEDATAPMNLGISLNCWMGWIVSSHPLK